MSGEVDPSSTAYITRDKYSKAASLHLNTLNSWRVYAGNSIESIDMTQPILTGVAGGVFQLPVNNQVRSYFKLVSNREELILAEKVLPLIGSSNFRDLGGIPLKGNRRLQWGKLFRADELINLTDEDLTYIASIPITSVIDFRAESEIKRAPDRLPKTARFSYPMTITPGAMSPSGSKIMLIESDLNDHMKQMNRLYVSDPACVRAYRIMFTIIQNNLSAPLVFHCSAGKDRTGMAAALILLALGASEETVLDDYMTSKYHIAERYKAFVVKHPHTEPMFTVKRCFMQAGFDQIKKDHGSIENFLINILKIDLPKLRKLYLEPVF